VDVIMLLSLPERRNHVFRAHDFHRGRTAGIHAVHVPSQWPVVGSAIQWPQVVVISNPALLGMVSRVDANTVHGGVVSHAFDEINVQYPTANIIDVQSMLAEIRPRRPYVLLGVATNYGDPSIDIRTINPTTDLIAPVVPPNEPWIAPDFLHIHIGPPAPWNFHAAFASSTIRTNMANTPTMSSARELGICSTTGVYAMENYAPRFRRFHTVAFGPRDLVEDVVYTGDGTPVPPDVQDFVDQTNAAPEFYRGLIADHERRVNDLGIDRVTYNYMGNGFPTTDDLLEVIADFFGFGLG
jgi:hypothetical protein